MSNLHGYSVRNFMAQLPRVLDEDKRMNALAYAIAKALAVHLGDLPPEEIYTRIDELPEALLDILAKDFSIDWYDYDLTIEAKRELIKSNYYVHRHLGTKAAVEAAISAIYPATQVQEWFEYGGEPYFFKLLIDLTGVIADPEAHERILNRVGYYKNLRSHIEEIQYVIRPHSEATLRVGGCMASIVRLPIPEIADTFHFTNALRAGGQMASNLRLPIPAISDDITLSRTGRVGVTGAGIVAVPPPEIPS